MRALLFVLCAVALFGCELVADFDRSKLVRPAVDGGAGSGGTAGGSADGSILDSTIPEPSDDAGDDDQDDAG
jgi:hypothetical protein